MNQPPNLSGGLGIYSQLNRSLASLTAGLPSDQQPWASGQPMNTQQIAALRMQRWTQKAQQRKEQIMREWVPHPLSREEYQDSLAKTNRYIDAMKYWEGVLKHTEHERVAAEDKLMEARIEYQILFWRSFKVNNLPDEILATIFHFATWSVLGKQAGVVARLRITWACRHWRRVALEDPTLWNVIWIRDPPPFDQALAWLDRSAAASIDVRLDEWEPEPLTAQDIVPFMDKLLLKVSSMRSLIVSLNTWEPALVILNKLREAGEAGAVFNLERFELHRNGIPFVQISETFQPAELRHPLALFGGQQSTLPLHFCLVGIHINWDQSALRNLTCLDFRKLPLDRCPTLTRFRAMLIESPNLYRLCLDGAGPQFNPEEARRLAPIHLKNLRSLLMADMQPNYACFVAQLFIAPQMRDLTLLRLSQQDYTAFFRLLVGRFPRLRILTLFHIVIVQHQEMIDTFIDFFASIPMLKYLRMANSSPIILEFLLWNSETKQRSLPPVGRALCPNFDTLEFHFLGPSERIKDWFDIVKGWKGYREKIGAPLRKLWIPDIHIQKFTPLQRETLADIAPVYVFHHQVSSADEMLILAEN